MYLISTGEVHDVMNYLSIALDSARSAMQSAQCEAVTQNHMSPAARVEAVLQIQAASDRLARRTRNQIGKLDRTNCERI